jgi:hypothetical protein
MASGLIDIMKRSALDAMDSIHPCDLRYGTVISEIPLTIKVSNNFILPESMLIVPERLTDYEIEVTISPEYGWATNEKSGGISFDEFASHAHEIYFERKKIKIHGALKVNDKVVLIRQSGGQKFLVADRLPKE